MNNMLWVWVLSLFAFLLLLSLYQRPTRAQWPNLTSGLVVYIWKSDFYMFQQLRKKINYRVYVRLYTLQVFVICQQYRHPLILEYRHSLILIFFYVMSEAKRWYWILWNWKWLWATHVCAGNWTFWKICWCSLTAEPSH